jgi:hypothetical protein
MAKPCGPHIVVNTERAAAQRQRAGRICDFAVAVDNNPMDAFILVEFKSHSASVEHAIDQLQGGADLLQFLGVIPLDSEVVVPMILSFDRLRSAEITHLRKARSNVRWAGRSHPVTKQMCGTPVSQLPFASRQR